MEKIWVNLISFFPIWSWWATVKYHSTIYARNCTYTCCPSVVKQAGWLAGWLAGDPEKSLGPGCTELGRPFGTSLNVVLWYKQIGLLYLMLRCIYGANTGLNFTISYTSRFTINKKNDFYTVTNKTKNV